MNTVKTFMSILRTHTRHTDSYSQTIALPCWQLVELQQALEIHYLYPVSD